MWIVHVVALRLGIVHVVALRLAIIHVMALLLRNIKYHDADIAEPAKQYS